MWLPASWLSLRGVVEEAQRRGLDITSRYVGSHRWQVASVVAQERQTQIFLRQATMVIVPGPTSSPDAVMRIRSLAGWEPSH